jgi:ABC-type multidrug transport system, ATPase component
MNEMVLRTNGLSKIYGSLHAVDHVNIEIQRGDIFGLVGKNGAGKTTLLRIISGLTFKNSGEFELFSEASEQGLNRARLRTGCMIETPGFFSFLSARKNLEYYRIQRGIPEKDCIDKVLSIVGLEDTGNKKFKDFSLGMKQRLGLALSLMGSPDFLILDEPINGLDPTGIVEFRELLKKLNREMNITILISSHILGELSQIATVYGFIDNGKLIEQISSKDLLEKCRHCLSVRVSDTSKAAVILEKSLDCTDYEVLNGSEIRIYKYVDTPEVISQAFVSNGIMVSSLSQAGASLENYFIKLIGGGHNA